MSKSVITVVIPHCLTVKWTQICIASMEEFKNDVPYDILIIDNSPKHMRSGLEGITKTCLGEGVRIEDNKYSVRGHAGALDYGLSIIDTPYLFASETDCQALRDHFLDRFVDKMKDKYVAMAGWYWPGFDREYIHCGGCLYSTDIVNKIKELLKFNTNYMICYGTDLKKRKMLDQTIINEIHDPLHGPFSELRGFQEIWSFRDIKWYQEPGAWLYYRCRSEYECVEMPGLLTYHENPHVGSGTWFIDNQTDSEEDSFFVHHWGGTVSHAWETRKVIMDWERKALPYWIEREDRIWRKVVPAAARNKVLQMGLVKSGDEEIDFILNHPNVKDVKQEEIIY